MDKFDIGDTNYNELYKLHTGHVLFDSDSDSSDSIASSFWEQNKPPVYTYEEIKSNMAVGKTLGEPVGIPKETGLIVRSPDGTNLVEFGKGLDEKLQKKLAILIRLNYCYLCDAKLTDVNNAQSHYNSKRHKNNLYMWECEEKKKLHASKKMDSLVPKTEQQVQSSITLEMDQSHNEILRKKLENLVCSNYCYLCNADLEQEANAQSHYNSYRHKHNLSVWKKEEIKKLVKQVQVRKTVEKADLPQVANAQSHYNSYRHKYNLSAWKTKEIKKLHPSKLDGLICETQIQNGNSLETVVVPVQSQSNKIESRIFEPKGNQNDVKTQVDPVCRICGINVGPELQEHYKSESHQKCVKAFCFVCNIKTMSPQQLAEHVKGIKHKNNLDIKRKDSNNLTLSQKGHTNEESLQNTKRNSQIIVEEANKEAKNKPKQTQVASKSVSSRWNYCDVCKMDLESTVNAEKHYTTAAHIMKNIFYCHLCKLKFDSITMIDYHLRSFPHNETTKLMYSIVSKGISTRNLFWESYEWAIRCKLCDAYIQSESSAAGHFGSKRHIPNFDEWCSLQSKNIQDPNRRWYYCDICKVPLDGTTKVELHYQGTAHVRVQKSLINTSQASNACSTTDSSIAVSKVQGKLDSVDNKQQIHKKSEIVELGISNNSTKIPSNTENKTLNEQTNNTFKTFARQSQNTQVSTRSSIVANSNIPRDAENKMRQEQIENMFKYTEMSLKKTVVANTKDENKDRQEQTENMLKFCAPKSKDTQVSTKETILATRKVSSDAENKVWQRQSENMFKLFSPESKNNQVSTKETILATSKISSDAVVWEKQTKNILKFFSLKSKDTQVPTKETIVSNGSKISSDAVVWEKQTENNFKFSRLKSKDTQVSTKEILISYRNISSDAVVREKQTLGTNTISRTDASTSTPKTEDSDKSNSTVEKGEDLLHLQEMVLAKTERLILTLKHIPPSEALIFLQKYNKELENFSKNFEPITVAHEDTIVCKDTGKRVKAKNMLKPNKTKNTCVVM